MIPSDVRPRWTPSLPLRADATDTQISERFVEWEATKRDESGHPDALAFVAREFAAACVASLPRVGPSPAPIGWLMMDRVQVGSPMYQPRTESVPDADAAISVWTRNLPTDAPFTAQPVFAHPTGLREQVEALCDDYYHRRIKHFVEFRAAVLRLLDGGSDNG